MKHRIWLVLLLVAALLAGCGQEADPDVELRSVLAKRHEEWYYAPQINSELVVLTNTLYAYDDFGNCIEERTYRMETGDAEMKWQSQTKRTFDSQGNMVSEKVYDRSKWFPIRQSYRTYAYDDQGRMLQQRTREPWFQWDTLTWEYGQNLIRVTQSDGTITEWHFDDQGNTRYTILSQPDGTQIRTESNRVVELRDEAGNLLETQEYDTQDVLRYRIQYDLEGRIILREYFGEDGISHGQTRCEYTADGVYTIQDDGSRTFQGRNSDGYEVEEHYDSQGRLTRFVQLEYRDIFVQAGEE